MVQVPWIRAGASVTFLRSALRTLGIVAGFVALGLVAQAVMR